MRVEDASAVHGTETSRPGLAVAVVLAVTIGLASIGLSGLARTSVVVHPMDLVPAGLFLAVTATVAFLILAKVLDAPPSAGLYILGVGLRAVSAVALAVAFQYDDEVGLHALAKVAAASNPLAHGGLGRGYNLLVGLLYWAFGPNLLVPKILNCVLGTAVAFVVADIVRRAGGTQRSVRIALLGVLVLPPFVIISAVNLKETSTALIIALIVRAALAHRPRSFGHVAKIVLLVCGLAWLRGAPWAALGAVPVVLAALPARQESPNRWSGRLVVGCALGVILVIPLFGFFRANYLEPRLQNDYYQQGVSGATVDRYLQPNTNLASPRSLAVLTLRGVYSPSPIRPAFDSGLGPLLELPSSLMWYLCVPIAVAAMWGPSSGVRRRVLTGTFLLLATVTATGAAFGADPARHRQVGFPLLVALAALALGESDGGRERRVLVNVLWWTGAGFFTLLYLSARGAV